MILQNHRITEWSGKKKKKSSTNSRHVNLQDFGKCVILMYGK